MEKPAHVLFLDDEANILYALTRLLLAEPYDIVKASDPDEAIDLIGKYPIKVVVTDYRMPKMSGIEFLRRVKEKYPDKIRILLSGYVDFVTAEEAINQGEVFRFITKPWKTDYLKASILHGIKQYDLVEMNRALAEGAMRKTTELRVLLASVQKLVHMATSPAEPLTEYQRNFLNQAKGEFDHMERLINDILSQPLQ